MKITKIQLLKKLIKEYSQATGVDNVIRGDKFKVLKGDSYGRKDNTFHLNKGGYNNIIKVPAGEIITFISERGNWDINKKRRIKKNMKVNLLMILKNYISNV